MSQLRRVRGCRARFRRLPSDIEGGICELPSAAGTHQTFADIRPSPSVGPGHLEVRQETFAFSDMPIDTGYVLFRYTFTNTGTEALTGLRVGFGADWDLLLDGGPTNDVARWNATVPAAEAVEQDSLTRRQIMGVVPIAASGTVSAAGWLNGEDPDHAGYFDALADGVTLTTVGPGDVRAVSGVGPFTIAAGERLVVYFALVDGDSRSEFDLHVGVARGRAMALGF